MKQTLTKIFQLAIALLIGGLAMTVYIQHRELAAQQTGDMIREYPPQPLPSNAFGTPVPSGSLFPSLQPPKN